MQRNSPYSKFIGLVLLIVDFFLLDAACRSAYQWRHHYSIDYSNYYVDFLRIFQLAWIPASLGVVLLRDVNIYRSLLKTRKFFSTLVYTFAFHALLIFVFIIGFRDKYYDLSRAFLSAAYLFSFGATFLFRVVISIILRYGIKLRENENRVVIVGAGYAGNDLYHYIIGNKGKETKFMGFFDDQPELPSLVIKGRLEHLKDYCKENQITEIYYAKSLNDTELIKDLADFADEHFIYFKIAPDFRGLMQRKVNIDFYDTVPIMTFRQEPLQVWSNRTLKRIFDIVFSLAVILLVFPWLFLIIGIAIKINSRGPIFFKQPRSGRKNKLFNCYKFRTMYVNNESNSKQATRGDKRITKVGAFLRKTSLDEMPQFFNVLMGDMSVVGPRPHMLKHTEEYSQMIEKYLIRHFVTPGITGHAQVNGFRGETGSDPKLMRKRLEYDTWYMENWSLWLDIKIIVQTVTNIFQGEENAF
ncbi:undecaprenyl-phosphate glucose phosphotransferase [Cytophagaceae bacterium YF14B1]|uniref:Undecaprenyl-phosphate glucose phosphotransferase n=1 Tax=Xanthocytophaga flava TaxID=3048013 RepID=A0AAE3U7X7_9BACT|nr:undecaprenyl-phosphate glucose phosphotransferase [Xanthocytophaga flavus]MDJ1483404.1 undecaprenyl-phosphate glucose phosphotransferase [Xanthocytophaga flavus]